jgi:hypothetical protein
MKSGANNGSEHRVFIVWRAERRAAVGFERSFEALLQRGIGPCSQTLSTERKNQLSVEVL